MSRQTRNSSSVSPSPFMGKGQGDGVCSVVDTMLAPFRMAKRQMLFTADIKQLLSRADNKATVKLMRTHMGAFRIQGRWQVSLTAVEVFLRKHYEGTPADVARQILASKQGRSGKRSARSASKIRPINPQLQVK